MSIAESPPDAERGAPPRGFATGAIRIRGARTHNLKNVDLDIPQGRLVVMTGLSGSGKSSLAFDTLLAEGQRQFIETLSSYARQFFDQLQRPDVDLIEGLPPTIAIDQRAYAANPRSTVATVTEIYDFLRVLMARTGVMSCPQCGTPIAQQTPAEIQKAILALPEQTKAMLLAPMVRGRKGKHADVLERIRKEGFVRVRIDGLTFELEHAPELAAQKSHDIDAIVDRVIIREGLENRLAESIRLALKHGEGALRLSYLTPEAKTHANGHATKEITPENGWLEQVYSTQYACPDCKLNLVEVEPRTFSFNSPYGACPACHGLAAREGFVPELVLPEPSLSLAGGAIAPWRGSNGEGRDKQHQLLDAWMKRAKIDWETPVEDWTAAQRHELLYGVAGVERVAGVESASPQSAMIHKTGGGEDADPSHSTTPSKPRSGGKFPGVLAHLEMDFAGATRDTVRDRLAEFRGPVPCPECGGSRLRPEARSCRLGGKAIHEITAMTIAAAREFFGGLKFLGQMEQVGAPLTVEIVRRLDFLAEVGVDYLALNRSADSLSGGEMQRVRLATGIGSGLVGVLYILDEPSIGLHPRDNARLIESMRRLQRQGNTVLVVEHDEAVMRAADWLIDVGPGAGHRGGEIIAEGTPTEVEENPASITGGYLSGRLRIEPPAKRRKIAKTRMLEIDGARLHNLADVDAAIPLGVFTCVTGVSGSGKSSLIVDTLAAALARKLHGAMTRPGPYRALRGVAKLERMVHVDQGAIGRSPRSNPATFTGAWDEIRRIFASTKHAKQSGYKLGRFSFNAKGGRCEHCQGQGVQRIEMRFLPDLFVTCPVCHGKQFNRQTLAVRYRDKSIADVLAMNIDEAAVFFENHDGLHRMLASLVDVGLGYLTLGQRSTTLSGGEAQRIKLAAELGRPSHGATLYILDEPTTGLHTDDVGRLLAILQKLVDLGHTVLVIEHNLDVIESADWVIDLGPDGGAAGGRLVVAGTPEEVAACDASVTGKWLRKTAK